MARRARPALELSEVPVSPIIVSNTNDTNAPAPTRPKWRSMSAKQWTRFSRLPIHPRQQVAIPIVLEQGWKLPDGVSVKEALTPGRNPHCTGAGLEVVASTTAREVSERRNPHCTGAGLEESSSMLLGLPPSESRNPHCTGAGLEVELRALNRGQSMCRNPHCTGAGLEAASFTLTRGRSSWSQSSLYWSRVGSDTLFPRDAAITRVAILIVLEQGWKLFELLDEIENLAVAILIVLEQGWKNRLKKILRF